METNYTKSNRLTLPDKIEFSELVKRLYNEFRNLSVITEEQLQILGDRILDRFDLLPIPIKFQGIQPHKKQRGKETMREKTQGVYHSRGIRGKRSWIEVYRLTAKRRQVRTPKGAISTLLHEIMHHLDTAWFGIDSIHCRGFYLRLQQLQEMLI